MDAGAIAETGSFYFDFLRELRVFVVNYSICFLLIEYTDLLLKLIRVELRTQPYP